MAEVTIALSAYRINDLEGKAPALPAEYHSVDVKTSSGSTQQSSITAPYIPGAILVWEVTASGGDVRVIFGDNPTATTTTGRRVVDGQTREFTGRPGQKMALIDATAT